LINIPEEKKKNFHAFIVRKQIRSEPIFKRAVRPVLRKQWLDAAKSVADGNHNIKYDIARYSNEMLNAYIRSYTVLGEDFFKFSMRFINNEKSINNNFETKDTESIFDQVFANWSKTEALRKVTTIIDPNTIEAIRAIIDKGVKDDKSNKQIAKDIRDNEPSLNKFRAERIAATEIHSVFSEVVDTAVKSSGLQVARKEWGSFLDERTRENHVIANGQSVAEDDLFIVGPDRMRFPGDITASAGNIIFCRCVAFYYTR